MARTTIKGIVSKTWTAGGSFGDVYKMSVISNGAAQMIPTQTERTVYAAETDSARLGKADAYEHAASLVQTYLNQEQQQIVGERLLGLR